MIPLRNLSPLPAPSHVACPLSTLLAHLSVLESQAEEVVQVGDSPVAGAGGQGGLACLGPPGRFSFRATLRSPSSQESGQVTLLPYTSFCEDTGEA